MGTDRTIRYLRYSSTTGARGACEQKRARNRDLRDVWVKNLSVSERQYFDTRPVFGYGFPGTRSKYSACITYSCELHGRRVPLTELGMTFFLKKLNPSPYSTNIDNKCLFGEPYLTTLPIQ